MIWFGVGCTGACKFICYVKLRVWITCVRVPWKRPIERITGRAKINVAKVSGSGSKRERRCTCSLLPFAVWLRLYDISMDFHSSLEYNWMSFVSHVSFMRSWNWVVGRREQFSKHSIAHLGHIRDTLFVPSMKL